MCACCQSGAENVVTAFGCIITDSNPQLAYDVLNAVITYYPDIAEYVVGSTVLVLLNESGVPSQPDHDLNLSGALKKGILFGVAVWAAILCLLAALKNTIHNEDEMKQVLNIPCLGQLPAVKRSRQTQGHLLLHKSKRSTGYSESLQLLCTQVEKRMAAQQKKVLLISSALPNEGKTTVSVNLAIALARKGKRVLLFDCDLRNPSVAKTLGIKNAHSLSKFLNGEMTIRDILCPTGIENLTLISIDSEEKNDIPLVSQDRTGILFHASRQLFDYVILDTPPCSLLADTAEIAALADCSLLVIRQDYASRDQILDGVQRLSDCQLPMLGYAFNYMSKGFSGGYGYGYGYGYGDYGYGYGYGHSQKTE